MNSSEITSFHFFKLKFKKKKHQYFELDIVIQFYFSNHKI